MRVCVLTVGTRGDVHPFVALAAGLRGAGHDVTLATSPRFAALGAEHGLRFKPLRVDLLSLAGSPQHRAAVRSPRGVARLVRQAMPLVRQLLDDGWSAARDADVIVAHPKALVGPHAAERLGVPLHLALPVPALSPTSAFPSPLLPPPPTLRPRVNRASHEVAGLALSAPYSRVVNRWRQETLGLGKRPVWRLLWEVDGVPVRRLYPASRHLVPRPHDWDATSSITEPWFLSQPTSWTPPIELSRFLSDGESPVYLGFGGSTGHDAATAVRLAQEALALTGRRGVIATGALASGVERVSDGVMLAGAVPHAWLFSRVGAVVHHGGAGTTAEGLRAGRPTVVCPYTGDQPFWGGRVAAAGLGPDPIPPRALTASALAAAIHCALTDQRIGARAAAVGHAMRTEDGVAQAAALIGSPDGLARSPALG